MRLMGGKQFAGRRSSWAQGSTSLQFLQQELSDRDDGEGDEEGEEAEGRRDKEGVGGWEAGGAFLERGWPFRLMSEKPEVAVDAMTR